jgi:hypothetical protein
MQKKTITATVAIKTIFSHVFWSVATSFPLLGATSNPPCPYPGLQGKRWFQAPEQPSAARVFHSLFL